ncbi:hypothetical protein SAMN05421681_103308 [Lysobacter enzymogenes]|nr:hypothetical protein SAMN05421681_103308 [Lysobacter enzymogenes]
MDRQWWDRHLADCAGFAGELVAPHQIHGVRQERFNHNHNSGAGAIALAAHWGARRVILLGYDCQRTGGQAHWHGDHPEGLANAGSIARWPAQFQRLIPQLRGVEVINASRETALTVFPRATLESLLT